MWKHSATASHLKINDTTAKRFTMKRVMHLLISLLISTSGHSQNHGSSNKTNQKMADSQNSDLQVYCDNEIDAHFPGGTKAWIKFVTKDFRMTVPTKNKAPKRTYRVVVVFLIAKDGKISDVKPETNSGYGIEEEVIRVIKHGPKWIPATNCGKKIITSKRQPVIIIIS